MPAVEIQGSAKTLKGLFERRLLTSIGKGGVGKTFLSASLALAASLTGKRVLLAEVRSRNGPALFNVAADKAVGPLALGERLSWINLVPKRALEIYGLKLLRFKAVYRAVFEQRNIQRFLRAVPALAEILVLGHLTYLVDQGDYDLIVLDAPSTGPGRLLLDAPRAVLDSAPRGPLYDGAAWINALLADHKRHAINVVVIPEELPVHEAIELHQHLRDDLGLPLGALLVNRLLADPFPPRSKKLLDILSGLPAGRSLAEAGSWYRARLRIQEQHLDRLRAGVNLPMLHVSESLDLPFGPTVIEQAARAITRLAEGTA
jgi:anion-transporting  ArsA/GET3 family ATPase